MWISFAGALAAGLVVAAIVSFFVRRSSTAELEHSDAEIKSQLDELEIKSADLQAKLTAAEAASVEQRARLEADYRGKLDAAEEAYRSNLTKTEEAYRTNLSKAEEAYRNNLSLLEEKFADLNAALYGQIADENEDNQADSEEGDGLNSTGKDSDGETVGTAGELAALAAIAENELLADSQTADDGMYYSLEKAVNEGAAQTADQAGGQLYDKLDEIEQSLDSSGVDSFDLVDAELLKSENSAEAVLDFEEAAGEEITWAAAVEEAETDELASSRHDEGSSAAVEGSRTTAGALFAAALLSDEEDIEDADIEEPAAIAPESDDGVEDFVETSGEISEPAEAQTDWLEEAEDVTISLDDAGVDPPVTGQDEIEPVSKLVPPVWPDDMSAWQGQYFNNLKLEGDPVLTREDAEVDFDWGLGSPAPEINADGFSARWRRTANLPPGLYRFTITSEDGVRLWVDGRMAISVWYDHTELTLRREVRLPGGPVELQLDYYNSGSIALIKVSWEWIG